MKSAERRALTSNDYATLAAFRYELRRFLAFSEKAAKAVGLTAQQHQALLVIKGMSVSGELLVGEIADFLLVRHHTAVELINRLEEAQLVQRRLDRSDGRKVHVALTLRAEKLLNKLSEAHSLELRMTRPGLFALLNRL